MILLKKLENKKEVLYKEDLDTIHPSTGNPIKAGDWQYLLVDSNMYRLMKLNMPNEIEYVKTISEAPIVEEIRVEVIKPIVNEEEKPKDKVEVIKPVIKKEVVEEIEVEVIKPIIKTEEKTNEKVEVIKPKSKKTTKKKVVKKKKTTKK